MTFRRAPHPRSVAVAALTAAAVGFAAPAPASAALQHLVPGAQPAVAAGPASMYHSVLPFAAYASKGRIAPGRPVTVALAGRGGLPSAGGFSSVAMTVTVSQATTSTAATVSPAGPSAPVRVVTAPKAHTAIGFVVVPVAATGAVRVRLTGGRARVRIVVSGYQQAGARGATFHPLTPAPVMASHHLGPGGTRSVSIVGARRTGLPPNGHIAAVALAVAASDATTTTSVTAYPRGQAAHDGQAVVSARRGLVVSGVAIVKVGAHGDVTLRNTHGHVTLSAKVEGYWTTDPTGASFRSVTPRRLFAGKTAAKSWRSVKVTGRGGVPSAGQTTAAVLSITAGRPSAPAYLAVAPTGRGKASSGQISVAAHSTVTTAVVARLTGSTVHIYASRRMSLTVSVVGWYGITANGVDLNASADSCASALPAGTAFAVIRATSGQPFHAADPTCFTTETTEAKQLAAAPQFYLNLADPGKASTANWHKGGPLGCHVAHDFDTGCAYDYGYEAARQAIAFAAGHGAPAGSRWWLDIEPDNSWGSHNVNVPGHRAANVATIHGALHYLTSHGYPSGIYTETAWWAAITGAPTGFGQVPVWGGGAGSRANARANCKQVSITGGPALLAQWFTNVQDDHDIAC